MLKSKRDVRPAQRKPLANPLRGRVSTTQAISTELRTAIVQGRLLPGEALRQDALARHFAVSHIPVREALRQLESEGWVRSEPHKGATVSALDPGEAREIYEMRAVLECLALRHALPLHSAASLQLAQGKLRAATRERDTNLYAQRNEEFHSALYLPAPRPHLHAAIAQLHRRGERYLRLKLLQPALKHESDVEHQALFDACARRDARRATTILTKHLIGTGELLEQHMDELRQAQLPHKSVRRTKRS
jgi:DNA-binding GntR family transcriptional regulator